MSRLEELLAAAVEARRTWRWDEVRRLSVEIEKESAKLVKVAATLPDVEAEIAPTPTKAKKSKKTKTKKG